MNLDNAFKYILIACTYRIWWPILKTMWNELQGAMWRDGGLLGRTPTGRDLVLLEEKYGHIQSPLTSETYAEFKRREVYEAENSRGGKSGSDVVQPAARREGDRSKPESRGAAIAPADYGRPPSQESRAPKRNSSRRTF